MSPSRDLVRRSLRARIALALSATTIAIVLLCGWFFFVYARELLVERTSDTLVGVASIVASGLPAERLEAYVATERSGNPDLTARGILLAQLQDVADRAGVEDLYLVDRSNRMLLDARRRLPFGEEDFGLSLADAAVDRAWSERAPVAAPLFDRPGTGYRLAAFAPVVAADGRMLAMVGAERALPSLAIADSLRDRFLWIVAGGVLLSLLAAALVSSTILRPVERLVRGIGASDPSGYPQPIPDPGEDEIGFLTRAFNRLIADLKGKDAALRVLHGREKARADLVLASVPTGVIGVDADGKFRLWNPAAASILGVPEERALGGELAELPIPPALRGALEAAAGGAAPPPAQVRWERGGAVLRLEIAAVPYRDESGSPLGAVALMSDVTERLRLERELRIRERLAALGEMSAGLAHEVRNPLAAIDGFAALLARKLEEPSQANLLEGLRREVEALNGIVTAFSRFARSPLLHRRPVPLGALLDELLPYFAGRGVEVTLDLNGVPPLVADPEEIRTVFANLLRNAVEAQPRGGGVWVEAEFDAARGVHIVRVRDRGPGIPPEAAEKVFNPFFTTKSDGTGMGLALVHRIVTAHGGTVRLLPGGASGATFEIELPGEAMHDG
jgi:two-component system sensor histidine kinase AtoS